MNDFTNALHKGDAKTENGAVAHSSTGSIFLDDFANAGTFRGREMSDVGISMAKLWATDPKLAVQSTFYYRMVTRKVQFKGQSTETVQKGAGLKDEFLKRYLWIFEKDANVFYNNFWLVPVVGSWRDMWQLLYYAETLSISLDKSLIFQYAAGAGMSDDLFLKYLPLEKSASKLKSERSKIINNLAKEFRAFLKVSAKDLRKVKVGGAAHQWQQLISKKDFLSIDFNKIPGKALAILTNGSFLSNAGLEKKYIAWIDKQPVAKFTGYPYELFKPLREGAKNRSQGIIQRKTIDKQFDGLLKKASEDGGITGNVWCALDTSASMGWSPLEDGTTPYDICISLGIYFSALNSGPFKDHVIMFNNVSKAMRLAGTASEKFDQINNSATAWGGTNFQSVIDEIVRIRKANPKIAIEDFPETLIVVSDNQFNIGGSRWGSASATLTEQKSNHEIAMKKLADVGLPPMKVIWWQVRPGGVDNVPSTIEDPGTYHFSGFDGAVIELLLGGSAQVDAKTGEKIQLTAEEVMLKAFQQDILKEVKL